MAPNTVCLWPGDDVNIYCAVPDSSVTWSSTEFGVITTSTHQKKVTLGPDIQLCFIRFENTMQEICANASATITNIPQSLDGLDITCKANTKNTKFSKVFVINVIGKVNQHLCLHFQVAMFDNCLQEI